MAKTLSDHPPSRRRPEFSFLQTTLPVQSVLADDERLITTVFEATVPKAKANPVGRDPMGQSYKIITAPVVLNYRHGLPILVRFLNSIRRATVYGSKRIFVDMSNCLSIDIVACMLLTAEIDRCQTLRPGFINGRDPQSVMAVSILEQLGFHQHLGHTNAGPPEKNEWIATIRSGIGNREDVSPLMAEVAELALRAWGDQAFADQIHAALNEAMTNVIMHAYPEELTDNASCLPGRWWVAGVVNRERNEAWFFAFDQGVGIPSTAINTYDGIMEKFEIDPDGQNDHLILAAAIKEARSQTGIDNHGQGLPAMIRLIDEKAVGGSIMIASGKGEHMVVKNPAKRPPLQRVEFGRALDAEVPGTLIVWKVDGPILAQTIEGGST